MLRDLTKLFCSERELIINILKSHILICVNFIKFYYVKKIDKCPLNTPTLDRVPARKAIKIRSLYSVFFLFYFYISLCVAPLFPSSSRATIARERKRKYRRKRKSFPRGGRRASDVLRVITRPAGFLSPRGSVR